MYEVTNSMLFGIANSFPSWLKILSLTVKPLPRSFLVRSNLIVLLCNSSGVPRIRISEFRNGTCTVMYFFFSAILFYY